MPSAVIMARISSCASILSIAGFFDVENFSLQRQNRLESPVASLLRRPACGLALDQEQLAAVRIALGAIRQLARQSSGIQRTLTPRQIASLAGGFTSSRRVNRFVDDLLRDRGILLEERSQALVHKLP